jgi:hypothetical protein
LHGTDRVPTFAIDPLLRQLGVPNPVETSSSLLYPSYCGWLGEGFHGDNLTDAKTSLAGDGDFMTAAPFLGCVFPSAEGAFAGESELVDAELNVDEAAGTFLGCAFEVGALAAGPFAAGAFTAAAFLTAVALVAFAEAAFFSTREPT